METLQGLRIGPDTSADQSVSLWMAIISVVLGVPPAMTLVGGPPICR